MLNFLKPNLVFTFTNVNIKYQNPTLAPRSSDISLTLSDSERFCIFADVKERSLPKPCRRQEPAQHKINTLIMKIASQQIGRGKLGNAIYAQVGGECIARQYQPVVANPSTTGQVEQRAKMKLITQLGAQISSNLAFRRSGLKSARNQFVSKNFPLLSYVNNEASINLNGLQLTEGNSYLPALTVSNLRASGFSAEIHTFTGITISRVVFIAYRVVNGALVQASRQIVTQPDANNIYKVTWPYKDYNGIVYAYGIIDTSEKATAKFNEMLVNAEVSIAQLLANRSLNAQDYRFTATNSALFDVDDSD